MSLQQYNSLMSNLLNKNHTFTKLRAKLKERKRKFCWCYKRFEHLAQNYRNKMRNYTLK